MSRWGMEPRKGQAGLTASHLCSSIGLSTQETPFPPWFNILLLPF